MEHVNSVKIILEVKVMGQHAVQTNVMIDRRFFLTDLVSNVNHTLGHQLIHTIACQTIVIHSKDLSRN